MTIVVSPRDAPYARDPRSLKILPQDASGAGTHCVFRTMAKKVAPVADRVTWGTSDPAGKKQPWNTRVLTVNTFGSRSSEIRGNRRGPRDLPQPPTVPAMSNTGRYMAITMKPTTDPIETIRTGSIRDSKVFTAMSTSSS